MTDVFVVRAEFGKYTDHFVKGGYVGGGWIPDKDLSAVKDKEALEQIYRSTVPSGVSPHVTGNYVGQIATFFLEIKAGDYIITPTDDTEKLRYGKMEAGPCYYSPEDSDGCPYPHRRKVSWFESRLKRSEFSVPFQYTLGAAKTAFRVSHTEEFLVKIGEKPPVQKPQFDPYRVVLQQILDLDAEEFELLVGHLLEAVGLRDVEVIGKPGDGGADATGELNVPNLAKVKVIVQAKRYRLGKKVNTSDVLKLRQVTPIDAQGALITTADYPAKAREAANDPRFQRIGLVNGHDLVDLLVENWSAIPEGFRERLGLKLGLVLQ
ncbi:MAG: restriction endonuclease [Chloroflexota bacterium]|nr:restriction endonuclease [Chloroflexota bacterium]MDE2942479.1 restriction endonuclease [Chloroflexota bacterium]MDE3267841.1 restriction endonuclease [Chloroflexota bacterium]